MLLVCFGQLIASLLEAFLLFLFQKVYFFFLGGEFSDFPGTASAWLHGGTHDPVSECDSRFMSPVILFHALYVELGAASFVIR